MYLNVFAVALNPNLKYIDPSVQGQGYENASKTLMRMNHAYYMSLNLNSNWENETTLNNGQFPHFSTFYFFSIWNGLEYHFLGSNMPYIRNQKPQKHCYDGWSAGVVWTYFDLQKTLTWFNLIFRREKMFSWIYAIIAFFEDF